jgi:hypothetical protein
MEVTIQFLLQQADKLLSNQSTDSMGVYYVDSCQFQRWYRKALLFLQTYYPNHPQTIDFENMVKHADHFAVECNEMVSILLAFEAIQPKNAVDINYRAVLENIFDKFHVVARQLLRRHDNRETLKVNDEYDVQDLLESLFKLFFDDVRAEEWCPSYAGGSKRMDFLLKNEEIVVEVKMTRDNLNDKKVGEQLIIDIDNYKKHPNCKQLFCFVYDPEGKIRNPRGLEADLTKETDGIHVFTYIYPR